MAVVVSNQRNVNEAMGILNSGQKENPEDRKYAKEVLKSASSKQKDKAREVLGLKSKVNRKGGGMTGEGLYPAEEARSGTMSQAKRKKYMKKGGKITYRMTGGQVVAASYDK